MSISRRTWIKNCALAGTAVTVGSASMVQAQESGTGLTDDQLEQLISGLGLKATKVEQRFDFGFKATLEEDQWELSMSAVLSQDGNSVWLMAWLDELPKSADRAAAAALRQRQDGEWQVLCLHRR